MSIPNQGQDVPSKPSPIAQQRDQVSKRVDDLLQIVALFEKKFASVLMSTTSEKENREVSGEIFGSSPLIGTFSVWGSRLVTVIDQLEDLMRRCEL